MVSGRLGTSVLFCEERDGELMKGKKEMNIMVFVKGGMYRSVVHVKNSLIAFMDLEKVFEKKLKSEVGCGG